MDFLFGPTCFFPINRPQRTAFHRFCDARDARRWASRWNCHMARDVAPSYCSFQCIGHGVHIRKVKRIIYTVNTPRIFIFTEVDHCGFEFFFILEFHPLLEAIFGKIQNSEREKIILKMYYRIYYEFYYKFTKILTKNFTKNVL